VVVREPRERGIEGPILPCEAAGDDCGGNEGPIITIEDGKGLREYIFGSTHMGQGEHWKDGLPEDKRMRRFIQKYDKRVRE
jgi:hypothetical protein